MNRRVAAGGPACSQLEKGSVIRVPDINLPGRRLGLCVTAQAKVGVTCHQQFLIDGTVRAVAGHAAFAHGVVGKHKGPGLILMTLGAAFIRARHGQSARRFEQVTPVRVMALHAIHVSFNHRMVLGQREFRMHIQMTLKAGGGVMAGIDDKFGAAAGFDVFAAGSVAGFAARLTRHG